MLSQKNAYVNILCVQYVVDFTIPRCFYLL
jgi:hypothetical protein